eukprot:Nk52_evm12s288 gene=Nk52_evmTU12s288
MRLRSQNHTTPEDSAEDQSVIASPHGRHSNTPKSKSTVEVNSRRNKTSTESKKAAVATLTHADIYTDEHFEDCHRLQPGYLDTHAYHGLKGMLMNPMPCCGMEYVPTFYEQLANVLTHAFGIVLAIAGIFFMLHYVEQENDFHRRSLKYYSALVFGIGMVVLFFVSSFYHFLCMTEWDGMRYFFKLGDHAVIYVFIAASYTPWLELVGSIGPNNVYGEFLNVVVWRIALFGIFFSMAMQPFLTGKIKLPFLQARYLEPHETEVKGTELLPEVSESEATALLAKSGVKKGSEGFNITKWIEKVELVLYLCMGWIIVIIIEPIMNHSTLPSNALILLLIGGLCYSGGVWFFVRDGRIPCAHAIWHIFVVFGAVFHYWGILLYLIMPQAKV